MKIHGNAENPSGKTAKRRHFSVAAAAALLLAVSGCGAAVTEAAPKAEGPALEATSREETAESTTAESTAESTSAGAGDATAAESAVENTTTLYAVTNGVNVRTSAESRDNVEHTLSFGDAVKATGTTVGGRWVEIVENGQKRYVAKEYLAETKPDHPLEVKNGGPSSGNTAMVDGTEVTLDPSWTYAGNSAIHTGAAVYYRAPSNRTGITVCVNAGHGCSGGEKVKTLSHPDGTGKVTGGTNASGAVRSMAISSGMDFADGTPEAKVNLAVAKKLKVKLLAAGYDVLMIRESDDVQLDNIARTVIANNRADCHIAIHFDSTSSSKGAFYMSVPDSSSYRAMEPVASHWQQHEQLGSSLIQGLRSSGVKIFSGGSLAADLTQTSYSTVPSVDIELGDKTTDHSDAALDTMADGLLAGVKLYFGK
jgi:N-acetylmuramoyl-L-alanine amidase